MAKRNKVNRETKHFVQNNHKIQLMLGVLWSHEPLDVQLGGADTFLERVLGD